jgi:hypothetical protein
MKAVQRKYRHFRPCHHFQCVCYCYICTVWRERERERRESGGSDRHHAGGDGSINFLFEGSQAMPASPSDRGEILIKLLKLEGLRQNGI